MYWNIVMDDWNLDENLLSKWQYLQHCKSIMPIIFYKEWWMILGFHLLLVTLHGHFTIGIEQDK